MKSITIHGLDAPLWNALKARAHEDGTSLNKAIKSLLEDAVGMRPRTSLQKENPFASFCGRWSQAEYDEFVKATAVFEKIDEEAWK